MPDYYGILHKVPNDNTKHILRLMSKLFKNIADKRVPHDAQYLNALTGFVQRCIDRNEAFCTSLMVHISYTLTIGFKFRRKKPATSIRRYTTGLTQFHICKCIQ